MGIRQEAAFKSNSEIFRRLAEVASVSTLTPEERYHYEADVKNARDTLNQIRGAFQEGMEKGMEKRMEKGIEKERRKSIALMLSLGIDPEIIAEKYNAPIAEVMEIAHSNIKQ